MLSKRCPLIRTVSSEVISEFERRMGAGTIGNFPPLVTEIIKASGGMEHIRTGKPSFTPADSVVPDRLRMNR